MTSRRAFRSGRRLTLVLLVDDVRDQRELYGQYLRHSGFEVAIAEGGVEAISKAIDLQPDVIVMDLSMPGIDGFEATKVLKSVSLTRDIPVVALTAYGPELPEEWATAAGCDGYLTKPLLPQDLAEGLGRFLRRRQH